MRYAYPCRIVRHEGNEHVVSFPDIRGCHTSGYSRAEALEMAEDALVAALSFLVDDREAVPAPSPVMDGQEVVTVPPVVAAKLELYSAMRDRGISKRALARRLGLSDTTVGRLADPGHRSHIDHVIRALRAVGRDLVVEGRAVASG